MTLPATGPLTRSQIKTEFGLGAGARWPTDFFGLGGVPAARPLKFSDFHGKSSLPADPVFNPAPGEVSNQGGAFTIYADRNVVWTYTYSGHATSFDIVSGQTAASITMNMGVNNTFSVWSATVNLHATYNGVTYDWIVDLSDTGLN